MHLIACLIRSRTFKYSQLLINLEIKKKQAIRFKVFRATRKSKKVINLRISQLGQLDLRTILMNLKLMLTLFYHEIVIHTYHN